MPTRTFAINSSIALAVSFQIKKILLSLQSRTQMLLSQECSTQSHAQRVSSSIQRRESALGLTKLKRLAAHPRVSIAMFLGKLLLR